MAEGGRIRGGICGLLDLIEEHRAALRYDWRSRFGKSLDDSIPSDFGWGEAIDLVRVLRSDPSSRLAASIEGWDYPLSHEGWMLADLIDVQGQQAYGKKWTPYRRPIKRDDRERKRRGNAAGRTRAEVVSILRQFGHGESIAPV